MFSISTMASSTRMPVTRVMASRLTKFSEKPMISMAAKAGHDGEGQGDGGEQGGAPVPEEQQHDEGGEDGAFDQAVHGGEEAAAGGADAVVDEAEGGLGVGFGEADEALGDALSATVTSLAPFAR